MNLPALGGEALLRLLGATWRLEWEGEDRLAAARRASSRGNVIYAFWHSSLLMLGFAHRRRDVQVLVSQHRDGELIACILERMGYGLVRGSSRRGGVEALFRLATLLEEGKDVAVTVDGPVGPRYSVHPGVVLLARRTGRPIVPIVATYAHGIQLGTWDALRLPALGTRVRIQHAAALAAEPEMPPERLADLARRLETRLGETTRAEEARWGREILLEDIQDRRSYWERTSESTSPPRALRALAALHAAGLGVERRLRRRRAGAAARPWVIGIGNLEAGGTGKTPCAVLLGRALAARGLSVAVLTRGHRGELGRRRPTWVSPELLSRASDETRLLVQALGAAVPVVASRDKAAGLAFLAARPGIDLVLVDDAFQTAGLAVDRHLVLLDWEHPLGNGHLLPAGRLREPPRSLGRAHALLFTRAGSHEVPAHPAWNRLASTSFVAFEVAEGLRTPAGRVVPPESLRGAGVVLLSGLARPTAFERLARAVGAAAGFRIRRCVRLGDHARLEPELRKLVPRLEPLDCRNVVVSRKDALRLPPGSQWNEPLLVLEQRLEVPALPGLLEVLLPAAYWSPKLANVTDSDA